MILHNPIPLLLKSDCIPERCRSEEIAGIEDLLKTKLVRELKRHPVRRMVNQAGNNKKGCVEPLEQSGDQDKGLS